MLECIFILRTDWKKMKQLCPLTWADVSDKHRRTRSRWMELQTTKEDDRMSRQFKPDQRIIFLIEICKFRCINHLVSFYFPLWMVQKLLCSMKNVEEMNWCYRLTFCGNDTVIIVSATFSGLLLLLKRFLGILLFVWPNPPIVRGKRIRIFPSGGISLSQNRTIANIVLS